MRDSANMRDSGNMRDSAKMSTPGNSVKMTTGCLQRVANGQAVLAMCCYRMGVVSQRGLF